MDTEKLGFELAKTIMDMVRESLDDIRDTLSKPSQNVLLEYIALLLWIVAKKAAILLPKESIQSTIDHTHNVIFFFLEDTGFRKIRMLGGYFNEKTFEDWIGNRFDIYYWAWEVYGPAIMAEMEAKAIVEGYGKEAVQTVREVNVAVNFIVCCFGGEAEYHNIFPNSEDRTPHTVCVLNHYRRFSKRIKSVLSRFDSSKDPTSINVLGGLGNNPS